MLTLCMNPGKIHDWSVLRGTMPVVSSNYGPFETTRETLDAFDAVVALAKADEILFVPLNVNGMYIYAGKAGVDLYFIADYASEEELRKDFDEVINFLKEY